MSEYIENENENVEETVEVSETVVETEEAVEETAETEVDAATETTENVEAEEAVEEPSLDDKLFDKVQRAARLLRNRKHAMGDEAEANKRRADDLKRALKLLELKPEMEQKEMSDLLGMPLRVLDEILRDAERVGAVTRVKPAEEDMRAIVISANENALELAETIANRRNKMVPQLSEIDAEDILALMDKIIDPLVAMGLDNDSRGGDRGGRGGFGGRGGDRGPRKDFGGRGGDRGGRGGFGGRGGDRGPRRDFGDRGPRKDFGDRGPRRDFGDRDRGGRGGYGDRDRKFNDRGGRGGYGDRRSSRY